MKPEHGDPLVDIQTQLSFHEASMDELNTALIAQMKQIQSLEGRLKQLAEKVDSLSNASKVSGGPADSEIPPHY